MIFFENRAPDPCLCTAQHDTLLVPGRG